MICDSAALEEMNNASPAAVAIREGRDPDGWRASLDVGDDEGELNLAAMTTPPRHDQVDFSMDMADLHSAFIGRYVGDCEDDPDRPIRIATAALLKVDPAQTNRVWEIIAYSLRSMSNRLSGRDVSGALEDLRDQVLDRVKRGVAARERG